jgi:hypothetical protein
MTATVMMYLIFQAKKLKKSKVIFPSKKAAANLQPLFFGVRPARKL